MDPQKNLGSQQEHLSSMNYDLRITNLAEFIYKKIQDSFMNRHDSMKLIDIGAGNGLFLKFFKQKGIQVAGIELEKEQVHMMNKDFQLKNVLVKQGDITKLTGKENYDIVIASDVIEHIEDDIKALRNLWTFVAPGGLLVITVPAHQYLYGKRDVAWGHYRRYGKTLLLDRIKKAIKNEQSYSIAFVSFWNIVGYFAYGFYEKILHKPISEKMRYSKSPISKLVRTILDRILKAEKNIGGLPLGLTLIIGVKKLH